jgi:hypothetical protein
MRKKATRPEPVESPPCAEIDLARAAKFLYGQKGTAIEIKMVPSIWVFPLGPFTPDDNEWDARLACRVPFSSSYPFDTMIVLNVHPDDSETFSFFIKTEDDRWLEIHNECNWEEVAEQKTSGEAG